jgi:hypothetical protein
MNTDVLRYTRPALVVAALAGLAATQLAPASAVGVAPRPRVVITAHPAHLSPSARARFGWRRWDSQRAECKLGSRPIGPCQAPLIITGLADGWHTFAVRAVAGRRSAVAAYRWLVDTTPPTQPHVAGGTKQWGGGRVVTAGSSQDSGSGLAGYQYRLRHSTSAPWGPPVHGRSLSIGRQGRTWVQFRALDAVGNASAWAPRSGELVLVDTVPPTVPVVSGYSHRLEVQPGAVDLVAHSTDASSGVAGFGFQTWDLESERWLPAVLCNGHRRIAVEGWHRFRFRAQDVAGNHSAWSPAITLVIG